MTSGGQSAAAGRGDPVERLLDQRVPLWLVLLLHLAGVIAMIGFGSIVLDPASNGWIGAMAVNIAKAPHTLRQLTRLHNPILYRGDYKPMRGGLWRNPAQGLVDPGFLLLTAYDEALRRPVVRLLRLSDGKVMHQFVPDIAAINRSSRIRSQLIDLPFDRGPGRNLMMHPMLMPNGDLIIHDDSPLARVDPCGRPVWMIDSIFHHAVERGPDGNIWAAYHDPRSSAPGAGDMFRDDTIAEISPDGRVLRRIRIRDLLDRNGLGVLWRSHPYVDDPFHLNDVQPVATSGPYWQRGDLLVSLRNLSLLMLYRPSTGRVLWSRVGPWAMQHDVSVLDDHRITVFDNHWRFAAPEGEVDGRNRVLSYDFATGQVSEYFADPIQRFAIRTRAQGRAAPSPMAI